MNESLLIALCFAPLAIIFVVMKVSLLLFETEKEVEHIVEESKRPHTWLADPYGDIDEEDERDEDF